MIYHPIAVNRGSSKDRERTDHIQTFDIQQRINVSCPKVPDAVQVVVCVKCGVQHPTDVVRPPSVLVSDLVQEVRCGDRLGGRRGWDWGRRDSHVVWGDDQTVSSRLI